MQNKFHGIICLWEFIKKEKFHSCWKLVESFAIDDDGYPLIKPKNCESDEHGWDSWMNKRDEDAYNAEAIMGRTVTVWTIESGVRLLDFNPPQYVDWLSVHAYGEIKKSPNWMLFLEDGWTLESETVRIVRQEYLCKQNTD